MKRIVLIAILLLLIAPSIGSAHSRLLQAVPADGSMLTASPDHITLTFNERIEPISNLRLSKDDGEEIAIGKAVVEGEVLRADISSPLANGTYSVKWTIIGRDSHVVEGSFKFTVDAPEPEPTVEPTPEPTIEPTSEPTPSPTIEPTEDAQEEPGQAEPDQKDADKAGFNYTPIIIIGIIIVGAAIAAIGLRRRK